MSAILPLFRDLHDALNPVHVSPQLRPYSVTITIGREIHELTVLAFKSCDAVCNAIDLFFDGEYEMPDAMSIKAHPANLLRAA